MGEIANIMRINLKVTGSDPHTWGQNYLKKKITYPYTNIWNHADIPH